MFKFCNTRTI